MHVIMFFLIIGLVGLFASIYFENRPKKIVEAPQPRKFRNSRRGCFR